MYKRPSFRYQVFGTTSSFLSKFGLKKNKKKRFLEKNMSESKVVPDKYVRILGCSGQVFPNLWLFRTKKICATRTQFFSAKSHRLLSIGLYYLHLTYHSIRFWVFLSKIVICDYFNVFLYFSIAYIKSF